jgi:hypothetical protein
MNTKKFYVYVILDSRKPGNFVYGTYVFDHEPFYIGKGKEHRMYSHFRFRLDTHRGRKIKCIFRETGKNPPVTKYRDGLTESEAFALEMNMIKTIGRSDLGTGPLTNKTVGGEGATGQVMSDKQRKFLSDLHRGNKYCVGIKHSDEAKKNMSLAHLGKPLPPGVAEKIGKAHKGEKHSRKWNRNIGNGNRGKKWTIEQRLALSKSKKGKHIRGVKWSKKRRRQELSVLIARNKENPARAKLWRVFQPDGTVREVKNLLRFCRELPSLKSLYDYLKRGFTFYDYRAERI